MAQNKIIVKVGNKSTVRFRNVKVYRAITVAEFESLAYSQDAKILIVENIKPTEYDNMLDFLSRFSKESDKFVFFYSPDNDETTTGVADELALDIYLTLSDLYRAIQTKCGIIVDIDISLNKKEIELDDDDPFNNDFDDPFGDAIEASSNAFNSDAIEEIEVVTIRNKGDAGFADSDIDLGIVIPEEIVEEPVIEAPAEAVETEETEEVDSEEVARIKAELESTKRELDDANAESDKLRSQVDEAIERIKSLNKTIKAVKDERDVFQSELKAFEEAQVIEDPVVMAEFETLKNHVSELELSLTNSSDKSTAEVEALILERDTLSTELTTAKASLVELEDKIGEMEIHQATLSKELADAKNDSAKDEQIASLTSQVTELNDTISDLNVRLTSVNSELSRRMTEIEQLKRQKTREISCRNHVVSLLQRAVIKLQTVDALQHDVATLKEANEALIAELEQLRAELEDKQAKLEKVTNDTEIRVNLARNFAQEELSSIKRDNIALKTQLDITTSQLLAKENQYNSLVQTSGMDESGALMVVENNKTLEAMNSTLRSQLAELRTAYDAIEREKIEQKQSISTLKEQNGRLTTQIRAMSSGYSGGAGVGVIPPINYSGRAQIISVTGSGSYGITTTAYSAAMALASRSRVLFIDFDMISPKSDSWFQMPPMVRGIPGIDPNSPKSSSLGIIVDRGVQFALGYANALFLTPVRNKGGCVDYLSGMYEKPDVVKLVSTDFTNLMNYCGNSYDYIVIDFGRIGASEINNQILKIFSDISRCTIMVTSSDRIDIRNARLDIQRAGIDMSYVSWIINLAGSTKIDEKSRARIAPAPFVQLPFIEDFYGQKKRFSENRISRDRFTNFLEESVLRR